MEGEVKKISSSIYDFICSYVPEKDILWNEPMCRHTTFRVGGAAECFIRISRREQLTELIPRMRGAGIPYFVLGNGSNLLVGDQGYNGVVLQVKDEINTVTVDGECIYAEAGALLSQVAVCARDHGLTGLEFASGIPGTIGGGVVMNAGAYGGEMEQIVEQVTVMDEGGEIHLLDKEAMAFGYRTSAVKNKPFIVLEVKMHLKPGEKKEISARMEELSRLRREKQPLEYASAGSTFKRPEGLFAGKLIMDAGLKGCTVGSAMVSEKHCGFIVNTGGATAAEIASLIEKVQKKVKEDTGVVLETEVIFLGDF